MEITYKNKKIEKECTNYSLAERNYGKDIAQKLQQRLNEISAAPDVDFLIQWHIGRCHRLSGNRNGQYAMDLTQPYRLIFIVKDTEIQIANIVEIVDYH